jgi:hypothetical protein
MDATCAMDENMPRESLSEALAYVGDLADICADGACITRLGLEESKLEELCARPSMVQALEFSIAACT